jgi:hypothetical protein
MSKLMLSLLVSLLFASCTFGQNVIENPPIEPQTITQPAGTSFSVPRGMLLDANATDALGQNQIDAYSINGTIVVDGVKYPQTAIGVNSAIAAATSGQTVLIPKSFSLGGTITLNEAGVTLQCINGAQLTLANSANSDLIAVTASNTRVTGCILDGNKTNQTTGGFGFNIASTRVNHLDIDHNQIQNTWNEGIRIANASYLRITQNRFINNGLGGGTTVFAIDYTMASSATTESFITISDNDIDETSSLTGGINLAANISSGVIQKWHLDRNTIIVGNNGSNVELGIQAFAGALSGNVVSDGTVNGNRISGADSINTAIWGISVGLASVSHGNVTVIGNTMRDTRAVCIEGIGSGISITGNTCDDTDGISVSTNAAVINGLTISSNVLVNGSGAYAQSAQIQVFGSPSYGIRGVVVSSNSILNVPTNRSCIYVLGNKAGIVSDSSFVGNTCIGQTVGMTQHALLLQQTSNIAVKQNMVRDWVGTSIYGIAVGSNSTRTMLSDNCFSNTTGTWLDQGTTTLIDDIAGVGFNWPGMSSEANGSRIFCTNCTIANPCASGGSGALAKRLNGAWVCN